VARKETNKLQICLLLGSSVGFVRIYQQQTSRVTRSKKSVAQSESRMTPSGIHVPPPIQYDASLTPSDIRADFQDYFYYHFSYLYSISFDNMMHALI
jgi:hypothetical protein